MTIGARASSGRRPPRWWGVAVAAALTAALTALAAVPLARRGPQRWVVLAAALAVVGLASTGHRRLRRRAAVLGRIHDFTGALAGETVVDDVIREALEATGRILAASTCELWINQGPYWVHYSATGAGVDATIEGGPARLEDRAVRAGEGIRIGRRRRRAPELEGRDGTSAMAVPFGGGDLDGALTVVGRTTGRAGFGPDDLEVLTAIATHTYGALRHALLLDRVTREAEENDYQARHDSLTGLSSPSAFAVEVDAAIAYAPEQFVVVILADLDSFKQVNDTLGHHVGDAVLKVIAARLAGAVGDRGVVSRLGGDEFAVALAVDSRDQAEREAGAVRDCIEKPIDEDGLLIEPRVSIGVALSPDQGEDAATLVRLADVAMYWAKEHRTGVATYAAAYDHYSPRRLALAGELRQALAAGELLVMYQPQQDLASGAITAVEALLRWRHRVHGFVPPGEFVPVAEQTGLITALTDFVLTAALDQQVRWKRHGLDLEVAVNLAARSLGDPSLPALISERLRQSGADAGRLTLELTETGLIADASHVAAILHQLAALGVGVSIDDFGTGYSSLSRLSDLPVTEVKIDKSFILAMANGAPETVVRSIIDLGHNLGVRVVAEGVEDFGTLQRLRRLRCDAVQGDLLSRAVPANVLEAWLADQEVGLPSQRVIVPLRKPRF